MAESKNKWGLEGWDTFARESYPLSGSFESREAAMKAALEKLKIIEQQQPAETSGGQSGIQDRIYIVDPEGQAERVILG